MATPRKNWFRLYHEILHSGLSNDELATLTRLVAHMTERWARDGLTPEQACTCTISRPTAMQITGKGRSDVALKLLETLARRSRGHRADVGPMSARCLGDVIVIEWPNFAELQELGSRSPGRDRGSQRPVDALSETRRNKTTSEGCAIAQRGGEESHPTAAEDGGSPARRARAVNSRVDRIGAGGKPEVGTLEFYLASGYSEAEARAEMAKRKRVHG